MLRPALLTRRGAERISIMDALLGLARALVASGKVKAAAAGAVSGAPVGGPAACLAGSCSQATLAQIANAEKTMPVLHLDPEQIIAGHRQIIARAHALGRLVVGAVDRQPVGEDLGDPVGAGLDRRLAAEPEAEHAERQVLQRKVGVRHDAARQSIAALWNGIKGEQ